MFMKKILITIIVIVAGLFSLMYADNKTDDSLIEELRIILTSDPMENNTYNQGECTYYAFDKVKEDGMMIERTWNDAEYWADRAEDDGYAVNDVPEEGSLMQTDRGEIGHVAYIETVHDDGSFDVSEMNFIEAYEVSERTITTKEAADYKYIHPKINKHAGRG